LGPGRLAGGVFRPLREESSGRFGVLDRERLARLASMYP
jgi:hypothetical protein